MKKIFILALGAIFTANLHAQNAVRFGLQAGVNAANMAIEDFDDSKTKAGFHAGIKIDAEIFDNVYLVGGIQYSLKGTKWSNETILIKEKTTINTSYLEIPVHMGYKYEFNDKFAVFGDLGPYFGIGLFGKQKTEYKNNSKEDSDEKLFEGDDAFLKRFDWGLGFNAGIELSKHFQIGVGYDWGINNIINEEWGDSDYSIRNKNFKATLAYMF